MSRAYVIFKRLAQAGQVVGLLAADRQLMPRTRYRRSGWPAELARQRGKRRKQLMAPNRIDEGQV